MFFSYIYDKCSCTQFYRHNISKRSQVKNAKWMKFSDSSLSTHLQIIRHTGSLRDTAADEIVVLKGIICPVVCASIDIGGKV